MCLGYFSKNFFKYILISSLFVFVFQLLSIDLITLSILLPIACFPILFTEVYKKRVCPVCLMLYLFIVIISCSLFWHVYAHFYLLHFKDHKKFFFKIISKSWDFYKPTSIRNPTKLILSFIQNKHFLCKKSCWSCILLLEITSCRQKTTYLFLDQECV